MATIAGWDIGGAHLKVACIENQRTVWAKQFPSLIWTDTQEVDNAISAALSRMGRTDRHAVTMTGELAEIFASRSQGVERLIQMFEAKMQHQDISYFAGAKGFLKADEAIRNPDYVASANWLASASFVATKVNEGIFLDIGSTTSDIIPMSGGKSKPCAFSDADRLTECELIYTGAIRTPVMNVTDKVPFAGRWQRLMGERFAIMADVYRILGRLPEKADQFPAVDGREKTVEASCARLARMLGRDFENGETWRWEEVARYLAQRQMASIEASILLALSRNPLSPAAPIIGAGSGNFIAEAIARRLDRPYKKFSNLVEADPNHIAWVDCCAPAVSVAMLTE